MTLQQPAARLMEDAIEGWGSTNTASTDPSTLCHPFTPAAIAAGTGRRVLCQILCPFFSQGKMLPPSLLGSWVLEIELGGYDDCFTTGSNITNQWEIQRPVIFADVITVDPSLTNSFAQHLLGGKELPVKTIVNFRSTAEHPYSSEHGGRRIRRRS